MFYNNFMELRRTYRYRLYPSPSKARRLEWCLCRCCELYNAGLQERRDAYMQWRKHHVAGERPPHITTLTQMAQLPKIKEVRPEYRELNAQLLQDVLQRLDRAFAAFFRRVRAGQTPGYPRFKSARRYDSMTYKQTGWHLTNGYLCLQGIGALRVKWSRPLEGTVKTVTIRREADQWYVAFSCVVEVADPGPSDHPPVGLDVGLEHFATLSTGEHIPNPRHSEQVLQILRRRHQLLSRKKKADKRTGCKGHRRDKARLAVDRAYRKLRNQRRDFHHKTALALVNRFGVIAVEKLAIENMVRRPQPRVDAEKTASLGMPVYAPNGAAAKAGLNRSITDAAWSTFITILTRKAAEAGGHVIAVEPFGTSQYCSACGERVPKNLATRWHSCPACGVSLQRDHNAALNILHRAGLVRQAIA